MIQRRKVIIGTLSAAAAVATIGGSAPGSASAESTAASGREEKSSPAVVPVRLSVTPSNEATAGSPAIPIVVTFQAGTLGRGAVTSGETVVGGSVDADGTWRSTGKLAYGKTYRVIVT